MSILPEFDCAGCKRRIDNPEEALVATMPGSPLLATIHDDSVCVLNYGAYTRRYPIRRRMTKLKEWWAEGVAVEPWGDRGLAKTYVEQQVAS